LGKPIRGRDVKELIVHITADQLYELRDLARIEQCTMSSLVREMIAWRIRYEVDPNPPPFPLSGRRV
jgi:hypothetical protein